MLNNLFPTFLRILERISGLHGSESDVITFSLSFLAPLLFTQLHMFCGMAHSSNLCVCIGVGVSLSVCLYVCVCVYVRACLSVFKK